MSERLLRPINYVVPGELYGIASVDESLRGRLNGLTESTFSQKYRGLEDYVHQPVVAVTSVMKTVTNYAAWPAMNYWYRDEAHTFWRGLCSKTYNSSVDRTVVPVGLPRLSPSGDRFSILAGYKMPGYRNYRTADYYAARELRRLRLFRVRTRMLVYRDENARRDAEKRFDEYKTRRLEALGRQLQVLMLKQLKRDSHFSERKNELLRLIARHDHRCNNGRRSSCSLSKTFANDLVKLNSSYLSQKQALDSKRRELQRKYDDLRRRRFVWRGFVPREYRPLSYDVTTGSANAEKVSTPFSKPRLDPHPVDHIWSDFSSHGIQADLTAEVQVNVVTPYQEKRQSKILNSSFWIDRGRLGLAPDENSHLDKGGKFAWSRVDVASAIGSIQWRPSQWASIPQLIIEWKDIPRTVRSFRELWHYATSNPLSEPGKASEKLARFWKVYSGADLARKFGADQMVSDITAMAKAAVEQQLVGVNELTRWLKDRGKVRRVSRQVGDVKASTSQSTVAASIVGPSTARPLDGDVPSSYYEYRYSSSDAAPWESSRTASFDEAAGSYDDFFGPPDSIPRSSPLFITNKSSFRKDTVTVFYSYNVYDWLGWELDDDEVKRRWLLDRLGFFVDPKLVWDLLPFSFVIDWLLNIKQLVGNYEIRNLRPQYTVYGAMLSRKTVNTALCTPVSSSGSTSSSTWNYEITVSNKSSLRDQYCRFQRQFIELDPSWFDPKAQLRFQPPSWWKLATAVELFN